MAAELSRIERKRANEDSGQKLPVKSRKIGMFTIITMTLIAIVFDVLSFIPLINGFTIFISDLIFIPWFYLCGKKFSSKRIVTFGITTLAEAIPGISVLPVITLNVLLNYYLD